MSDESMCAWCKKRPGTIAWSEGTVAYVHGFYAKVCEPCALRKQLDHARERVAAIPEMEARLRELGEEVGA